MNNAYPHGVYPNSLAVERGTERQGRVIRITSSEVTVDWGGYNKIYYWRSAKKDRWPDHWLETGDLGAIYRSRVRFVLDPLTQFTLGLSPEAAR